MRWRLSTVLLLALVACRAGGDGGGDLTTQLPPTSSPTSSTLPPGPGFDWARPKPADLGGGFVIEDCDGDAPFFCVRAGGAIVGVLEVLRLEDEGRTLAQHAAMYFESIRTDRADGCGPGYRFTPDPVRPVQLPDGPAVIYGFTGTLASGAASERVVQYAGPRDGRLVILTANANDDGGCLSREGEFTTAQLRAFEPRLDALVRRNGLPSGG